MTDLYLERFSYAETETEGRLITPNEVLYTMERPWLPSDEFPAGKPFYSCAPEGTYTLVPYERTNGHEVWALVNESLGVFFGKANTSEPWHRYKMLIHPGNTVDHSAGCVLPGLRRGWLKGKRAVMASGYRPGYAMDRITNTLGAMSAGHTLTIGRVKI